MSFNKFISLCIFFVNFHSFSMQDYEEMKPKEELKLKYDTFIGENSLHCICCYCEENSREKDLKIKLYCCLRKIFCLNDDCELSCFSCIKHKCECYCFKLIKQKDDPSKIKECSCTTPICCIYRDCDDTNFSKIETPCCFATSSRGGFHLNCYGCCFCHNAEL